MRSTWPELFLTTANAFCEQTANRIKVITLVAHQLVKVYCIQVINWEPNWWSITGPINRYGITKNILLIQFVKKCIHVCQFAKARCERCYFVPSDCDIVNTAGLWGKSMKFIASQSFSPTLFSLQPSSLVKSEPPWLQPEELKFKANTHTKRTSFDFCV